MHAYLFISQNLNSDGEISKLAKKLHAKILDFPIAKIEDARNLNNLIRLSFDEPNLVVCKNIHEATEEALNAFLKNLEEPQENIYFALTAPSVRKVLPTIASRCQIMKSDEGTDEITDHKESEEFMDMGVGEKLNYIGNIKDRSEAVNFAERLVFFMHSQLHKKGLKYNETADNIVSATETLTRLKANGNVNLQLANLVSQLSNAEQRLHSRTDSSS